MSERTLFKALSAVQADLAKAGIAKQQENTFDKYKFRGIDDVLNALAPILANHGVVIMPSVKKCKLATVTTSQGKTQNHCKVEMEYTIYDVKGDSISHTFPGEAMDRSDKAINKACTAAYKYFLFEAFTIPVEGTPDADSESPTVSSPAKKAPAKKAPAKQVASKPITPQQVKAISALIEETQSDLPKLLEWVGVQSIGQITQDNYDRVARALKGKKQEAAA
jgi:hypothetical protein